MTNFVYPDIQVYDEDEFCWPCSEGGSGIIGLNWDCDDLAINDLYDSEWEICPCCYGSGLAEDCIWT